MLEYKLAIEKWGVKSQIIKAIEEMAELTVELSKFLNYSPEDLTFKKELSDPNIEGEIADVSIMIGQLELIFKKSIFAFNQKIVRLNKKLRET